MKILRKHKEYIVLSVLLCLISVFGITQYKKASELEYYTNIEYTRVFTELTEYVDDLEISLLKGQLVQSPGQLAKLSSDLMRQASGAKANLALLPIEDIQLEKTSEFLSQVGEYANSISEKMQDGKKPGEKELKTLEELTKYATVLKNGLDKIEMGINDGTVSFADEKNSIKKVMKSSGTAMAADMENLEKEFHDYPSLIYDGPFSQHLTLKKSIFTQGKPEITKQQAKKYAAEFIPDNKCEVKEIGGRLPSFSVKNEDITIEYTKNGGILLLLMKNRQPGDEKLSVKQAKKKASEFLQSHGFENMTESYYDKHEGSVVLNYAYKQGDYIVYSDLVKVKVALDNGEIIGFESRGYVMNHEFRIIPEEKITKDEALKKINPALSTEDVTMAVIPLESGKEAYCYQLKGKVMNRHFLIYINTQSGNTEDMQILLETENGTLAV